MIVSILGNGFVFKTTRVAGFDRLYKNKAYVDSIRCAVKNKLNQAEFWRGFIGKSLDFSDQQLSWAYARKEMTARHLAQRTPNK